MHSFEPCAREEETVKFVSCACTSSLRRFKRWHRSQTVELLYSCQYSFSNMYIITVENKCDCNRGIQSWKNPPDFFRIWKNEFNSSKPKKNLPFSTKRNIRLRAMDKCRIYTRYLQKNCHKNPGKSSGYSNIRSDQTNSEKRIFFNFEYP